MRRWDWATYTLTEWAGFSLPLWSEFLLDPEGPSDWIAVVQAVASQTVAADCCSDDTRDNDEHD